jgi:hypothetical protein
MLPVPTSTNFLIYLTQVTQHYLRENLSHLKIIFIKNLTSKPVLLIRTDANADPYQVFISMRIRNRIQIARSGSGSSDFAVNFK